MHSQPIEERAERIVARVTSLPQEDRAAYLDEQCGADVELRDKIELYLDQRGINVPGFTAMWRAAIAGEACWAVSGGS